MNISGKTRLMGLVGNPVEHSISPKLHNTLCSYFNMDMVYLPFIVYPEDLARVVEAFRVLDMAGFNITIPYKVEIIKLLDSVNDDASTIGAVNTVKITGRKLYGFNTDGLGFIRSLKEVGFKCEGTRIVILGAGGAARAVAVKLAQNGAEKLTILNRSVGRAKDLADLVNTRVKNICSYGGITENELLTYSKDCDAIINTTPIGMWPHVNQTPVENEGVFINKPLVCDLIYNPTETLFLSMGARNSCKTLNGLGMLIYQGVAAFEIWNEVNVPEDAIREATNLFNEYFKAKKEFK